MQSLQNKINSAELSVGHYAYTTIRIIVHGEHPTKNIEYTFVATCRLKKSTRR
jgi:hypothetical protein